MSTPKFCRDCRHCDLGKNSTPPFGWPDRAPALHWWCSVGAREHLDIISGNHWGPAKRPCGEMRANKAACGPDAKLFEPRADPICPKCFKAVADTHSGGRTVCLQCAYEEHT